MKIHVAFGNIDAKNLELVPTHHPKKFFCISNEGKKAINKRFIIFDKKKQVEELLSEDNLSKKLLEKDDDIDLEVAGKYVKSTSRISVGKKLEPVYNFSIYDIITRPDGSKQERKHLKSLGNINMEIPVNITDELFDPKELLLKYIFRKSYYITHYDGATYKFLYDIAKKLFIEGKFAKVEAYHPESGKKDALILYDGGRKFPRAFVEGRVNGDSYSLILHISDQEIKLLKIKGGK